MMPWAKYKIRQQERQGEKLGNKGDAFLKNKNFKFPELLCSAAQFVIIVSPSFYKLSLLY